MAPDDDANEADVGYPLRELQLAINLCPPSDTPESPLYHYTNAAGFLGIINSRKVWATHCRYLNDHHELLAGGKIVGDVARKLKGTGKFEGATEKAIESLRDNCILFPTYEWCEVFIASFTVKGNLLSQWRAYAENGSGYSLGFSLKTAPTLAGFTCQLVRCEYDEDAFRERVRSDLLASFDSVAESLRRLAEQYELNNEQRGKLPLWAGYMLLQRAGALSACFKAKAFSEEHEWRLVVQPPEHALKFRTGPMGITPYVEVPLTDDPNSPLPLEKVYVGPSHAIGPVPPRFQVLEEQPSASSYAANRFLKSQGYALQVTESEIPFRWSK